MRASFLLLAGALGALTFANAGAVTQITPYGVQNGDFSVNPESVPPTGYSLVATIPAKTDRNDAEVQNRSTDLIKIVLDDGKGTAGATTIVSLAGASVSGGQGGAWSDGAFKGRIRVYVPTANTGTDTVEARQD